MNKQYLATEAAHESRVQPGSDRSFGIVFSVISFLLAGYSLWHGRLPIGLAFGGIGLLLLFVALWFPARLHSLNLLWFRLGLLLHHVVSPIIMGLLFWLTLVPTAIVRRALGKPSLPLTFDMRAETYWTLRRAEDWRANSMIRQF
jgi:membrane-bound ClpP family serine protease